MSDNTGSVKFEGDFRHPNLQDVPLVLEHTNYKSIIKIRKAYNFAASSYVKTGTTKMAT